MRARLDSVVEPEAAPGGKNPAPAAVQGRS